jgi:hypothetical protein
MSIPGAYAMHINYAILLTAVAVEVSWFDAVQLPSNWIDVSFGSPELRLCSVAYQELEGC